MRRRSIVVTTSALAVGAAVAVALYHFIGVNDVYVADFKSDHVASCRPSDVDLNRAEVADFFHRARRVESKELHDHYDLAPCAIQGTLRYRLQTCEWEVRAGATGSITCGGKVQYFVCDTCQDLFTGLHKP